MQSLLFPSPADIASIHNEEEKKTLHRKTYLEWMKYDQPIPDGHIATDEFGNLFLGDGVSLWKRDSHRFVGTIKVPLFIYKTDQFDFINNPLIIKSTSRIGNYVRVNDSINIDFASFDHEESMIYFVLPYHPDKPEYAKIESTIIDSGSDLRIDINSYLNLYAVIVENIKGVPLQCGGIGGYGENLCFIKFPMDSFPDIFTPHLTVTF